ncbi:ABC transporter permease subunit [Glycomyces tarimensis]
MTTAVMNDGPAVYTPPQQYKLSGTGLLRSEWTKFWSLRSSWIVLICAALFGAGIGVAVGYEMSGASGADLRAASSALDVLFGFGLSAVFIAVLGVLFISGEYTTGSVRSTMAASPRRTPVLWAKAAVFGAIVLAIYGALVAATFFVTQMQLDGTVLGGVSLSDPGVFRIMSGYVATIVYLGLLGLAVGAILRNSAGAISFYVGVIMVLPMLMAQLPWAWVADLAPYTPGNVSNTLTMNDTAGATLSPGESWLWMGVWMVVSFGLAAVLLKRRDV